MGIMIFMAFLSTSIRFFQEWKSLVKAKALIELVTNTVCVLRYSFTEDSDQNVSNNVERNVIEKEVSIKEIVPGDLIKLSAGNLIPADIQLIESKDLYVSQSSLTGEAMPVEKYVPNILNNNNANPIRSVNLNNSDTESEVNINMGNNTT
jgi:Mg2+-importing ATPase